MEPVSDRGGSAPQHNPTCSFCGFTQEMQRLTKTLFHCTSCGRIVAARGLRLEVVREPTLALSQGLEVGAV
jgi:ribosomal protein L37AE/L43A